ncbi:hypothetical protein KOI40_15370 [Aestuariicella sp. G3-2]|uniref:hypothetical protein n=1 Tax=Pseudomaricurvus albidus TaxID=2842452 RepID=UPI001C0AA971|nr:hypothetical protein [Aestuariicella albida]MBU3071203.1 hypothetical protein [Aestuariicella albida]
MPEKIPKKSTLQVTLQYALAIFIIATLTSLLTLLGANVFAWFSADEQEATYYHKIPFDQQDAVRLCEEKAESKFGERLVRTDTDWRSTRFEAKKQTYLVLLNGTIGDYQQNEQAKLYCYVDPDDKVVTYFRAYDLNGKSLLSRSINMEAMLEGLSSP